MLLRALHQGCGNAGRELAHPVLPFSEPLGLRHGSAADKRAYVLADNKLAEKAGWDRELLAIELQGLIELDVDIELEFAFTDPPYNVAIDGHVCGLGRIQHREFAMGCGEMSEAEFTAFLKTVFALLADNSIDGSIHQVCMDWRHIWEMLEAGRTVYSELKNLCVWNKTNAGMAHFTAPSTSWCSFGSPGPQLTSTISSLANTGAIAAMSGIIPELTRCVPDGWKNWRCTRPSSQSPWWRTRSRTARAVVAWCSILSVAAAPF